MGHRRTCCAAAAPASAALPALAAAAAAAAAPAAALPASAAAAAGTAAAEINAPDWRIDASAAATPPPPAFGRSCDPATHTARSGKGSSFDPAACTACSGKGQTAYERGLVTCRVTRQTMNLPGGNLPEENLREDSGGNLPEYRAPYAAAPSVAVNSLVVERASPCTGARPSSGGVACLASFREGGEPMPRRGPPR